MNTQKLVEDIVAWLKNYCLEAGLNGFAIGCSGGIDSSVTSTLCAMTGLEVRAYGIDIHSSFENSKMSDLHLMWLQSKYGNVITDTVDLGGAFYEFIKFEDFSELAKANTKARLRMTYLYAQANTHDLLVALTGNKIEDFGVFFCTKGGDNFGDISPIADLYKSKVYEIGRYLGIEEAILTAPPNDGLHDGAPTDEEQLGATYDELEWAMENYRGALDTGTYQFTERQIKVLSIYTKLHNKGKHKSLPIPVFKFEKEKYE